MFYLATEWKESLRPVFDKSQFRFQKTYRLGKFFWRIPWHIFNATIKNVLVIKFLTSLSNSSVRIFSGLIIVANALSKLYLWPLGFSGSGRDRVEERTLEGAG